MSGWADVRKRAWETRRDAYGQSGHAGAYRRPVAGSGAVDLLIRLYREGVVSEGQISTATGLDRVTIRTLADRQAASTPSPTHETGGRDD